jgi:NADPH:quinone reductase-like Zn-dependent oxidoreductase
MKALLSRTPGGPETLELVQVPEPPSAAGRLLVRVAACSINYPDALIIEDKYQFKPDRPFVPGGEIAGTVVAVGEGVTGWAVGDRLIAATIHGGLAEMLSVPAGAAHKLPDDVPFAEGATFLMTYATVIHALVDRGRLAEGETLLVLGGAGGIGIAAIEIGKARGARVIAAVSGEEKAQAARDAGADEVVFYGTGPFDMSGLKALGETFKAAVGPDGADVILDPVGGDYAEPALRSIGWAGRYLVIGFTAGIPKIPLNLPLLKGCDILGVFWGGFVGRHPARNRENVRHLFQWWREGKLRAKVERTFPLDAAADAIACVAGRKAIGKVVVTVPGD